MHGNRPYLKKIGHVRAKYYVHGLRLPLKSIHRQIGKWFYYNFAAGCFHTKKLYSRLLSTELDFYSQERQFPFLSRPFGVWLKYALHLQLVGKRLVDFLLAIIKHFSLALTVETLRADIGRIRRFSEGVGHFERKFQVEGNAAPNHCWHQNTSVFAASQ